jgi:hypothetical protein
VVTVVAFVSVFTNCTAAFGTIAPLESVTVPTILPVVSDWEETTAMDNQTAHIENADRNRKRPSLMIFSPGSSLSDTGRILGDL